MKLIELISRQRFVGFGSDTPVLDATRAMVERRIGAVAVVDGERLLWTNWNRVRHIVPKSRTDAGDWQGLQSTMPTTIHPEI